MKALHALGIAVAASALGLALWWSERPEPVVTPATISGAALYATTFRDVEGRTQALGQFQGRTLVINFWATWCAPCREEMPALARLHHEWRDRGVAFVGISDEPPEVLGRFGREVPVGYPLWSAGGAGVDLAGRLGDRTGSIPFTAVIDGDGRVVRAKVGPYTEVELRAVLQQTAAKHG